MHDSKTLEFQIMKTMNRDKNERDRKAAYDKSCNKKCQDNTNCTLSGD